MRRRVFMAGTLRIAAHRALINLVPLSLPAASA